MIKSRIAIHLSDLEEVRSVYAILTLDILAWESPPPEVLVVDFLELLLPGHMEQSCIFLAGKCPLRFFQDCIDFNLGIVVSLIHALSSCNVRIFTLCRI